MVTVFLSFSSFLPKQEFKDGCNGHGWVLGLVWELSGNQTSVAVEKCFHKARSALLLLKSSSSSVAGLLFCEVIDVLTR